MKKLAAQQVQREKEEGQKRLEEALVKAREEYMIEKANAVQKAREEERVIATEEAKRVAQVEEDKRKQLILAAEKEKQVNIPVVICFFEFWTGNSAAISKRHQINHVQLIRIPKEICIGAQYMVQSKKNIELVEIL